VLHPSKQTLIDFIFCGVNKQTWQVFLTPAKVFCRLHGAVWINAKRLTPTILAIYVQPGFAVQAIKKAEDYSSTALLKYYFN